MIVCAPHVSYTQMSSCLQPHTQSSLLHAGEEPGYKAIHAVLSQELRWSSYI